MFKRNILALIVIITISTGLLPLSHNGLCADNPYMASLYPLFSYTLSARSPDPFNYAIGSFPFYPSNSPV